MSAQDINNLSRLILEKANRPEEWIDKVLSEKIKAFSQSAIIDRIKVRFSYHEVWAMLGYYFDNQERFEDDIRRLL